MSVVIPDPPADVPECEAKPSGRSFVTGIRAAAVGASDAADVMRGNAAPEEWAGDAAEVANHSMTTTADDLDGAVAAMQKVVTAGDRFFDRLDRLLDRRQELVDRGTMLKYKRLDLKVRAESYDIETEEAGLQEECRELKRKIDDFDGDVTTWQQDLTSAEDDFIAALQAVDTVAEGDSAAASAPDTGPLAQRAAELQDDPEAMNRWWTSLTPAQQEALKISDPELIGNSNGVPVTDRDDANRANLSEDLNTLLQKQEDGELTDDDRDRLERLEGIYESMRLSDGDEVVRDPATLEPVQSYLLMYQPGASLGDGMAALSWGNPDTADHVSVNVPGFSSTLDNFDGVSGDALSVYDEASREGNGSVASIAWLGYNAPDFDGWDDPLDDPLAVPDGAGVGQETLARAGAANLSDFIDGLRASDQGDEAHMTAIGHSYGSTTVAKASGDGLDVDNTVLVGSPGAGAGNNRASDLSGDVYVGSADNDFVTRLGNSSALGLGDDPAGEDFGATRFQVDDANDDPFSLDNHTSYFDPGSSSLDNVGRIVAGNGDEVEAIGGRDGLDTAGWWVDSVEQKAQEVEDAIEDEVRRRADDLVQAIPRPSWPF